MQSLTIKEHKFIEERVLAARRYTKPRTPMVRWSLTVRCGGKNGNTCRIWGATFHAVLLDAMERYPTPLPTESNS